MSARTQVIIEIGLQRSPQRSLVENYEVVQAFSLDGAHQSLGVRILPRRSRRREDFTNPRASDPFTKQIPINRVAVMEQIARGVPPGKCLCDLLGRPFRGGMRRNIEMKYPTSVMTQSNEDEQDSKTDCRNDEKVCRDQLLCVVMQESTPGLGGRFTKVNHVIGNCRLGHFDAKF